MPHWWQRDQHCLLVNWPWSGGSSPGVQGAQHHFVPSLRYTHFRQKKKFAHSQSQVIRPLPVPMGPGLHPCTPAPLQTWSKSRTSLLRFPPGSLRGGKFFLHPSKAIVFKFLGSPTSNMLKCHNHLMCFTRT